MKAAKSDTIYCYVSTRPFLVWSCFAPSMLCPAGILLSGYSPPAGTDAVKALYVTKDIASYSKDLTIPPDPIFILKLFSALHPGANYFLKYQ